MKKVVILSCFILLVSTLLAQQTNTSATKTDLSYFITHTREELVNKLVDMPFGINSCGLVTPDRKRKLAYYEVKKRYNKFKNLLAEYLFFPNEYAEGN